MDKNAFKQLLSGRILIMDGALGTELQKRHFLDDVGAPEELNLKFPERLAAVHRDYLEAGSDLILANTFGANRRKLADYGLEGRLAEINEKGIAIARKEAAPFKALVGADIGPLGSYLAPLGPLGFDEAYELFAEQVKTLNGADLLIIETMAEIREVKAALLAAKDHFPGPVLVQMTFTAEGSTVTGTDLPAFLAAVEGMGADGIGMNCSVGPQELAKLAVRLARSTELPVSFKPNSGMPKLVNRETVFPGTVEEFLQASDEAFRAGVNMLGGCCGTTPAFIKALAGRLKGKKPAPRTVERSFLLSSRTKALDLAAAQLPVVIGERINPTNRKTFQDELRAGNFATLRREAQAQVRDGARLLDLNLGLPGADEKALMTKAVEEIQETVSVPLCLDSSSAAVLEAGIKACAGKPLVNSVNGDETRLSSLLPLCKRFGAAVIGLATDEGGLPKNAEERLAIAERIIAAAERYGIPRSEVVIDYLTLAVSAMPGQAGETLAAIRRSKRRWPDVRTVLGVSNISFGLPSRQVINSTFRKMAVEAGLDLAICNPHEDWTIDDPLARELLTGTDRPAQAVMDEYLKKHAAAPKKTATAPQSTESAEEKLYRAVVEGDREEISSFIDAVLAAGRQPLEIANSVLLKALNEVGEKFNAREYFLPQVIRSAEAAQAAFARIKPLLKKDGGFAGAKVVLATVKGDVHDIGKNIVAAVLESHGFEVIDLGKNVDADEIVRRAGEERAPLIGVSALMTTTMLEMEKVVQARDAAGLAAKVLVGGAPVTERFAREIRADAYAKDAVEAARLAKELTAN